MTTLQMVVEDARPVDASCGETHLQIALADGRMIEAPLWWYPRLLAASAEERGEADLIPLGIHWLRIDDNISFASTLRGDRAYVVRELMLASEDI